MSVRLHYPWLVTIGYGIDQHHIHTYLYTSVPCRPSVCLLPDVRGHGVASPLISHVTKGGRTVVGAVYHEVRGGAISPRSLKQRTAGSRRHANSSGDIAARWLPLCACRARKIACWMSHQIQANSRGYQDGAATVSAR